MSTPPIPATFQEFLWLWNNMQQLSTPAIHFTMGSWLNDSYLNDDKKLLLQAFRSSGKSTIVGLFVAWLLYKDANLRIMILSAEHHLATKMVRNVKHICERHPLMTDLKPKNPEQWASGEFTISRSHELRDPSVVGKGITSNFTGSRGDIIICDDVEVPNNSDTAHKRQDLREKLSEIDYVLTPDGLQLYIGTPHNYYSIYSQWGAKNTADGGDFLADFKRLYIPITNEKGQSNWPEKFSNAHIRALKMRQGPNKFESQMMLKPLSPNAGRLNPDNIEIYSDDIIFEQRNGQDMLLLRGEVLVSSSCWWDPSFATNSGDASVIACVFTNERGQYFLHDLCYITLNDQQRKGEDNARQQCRIVAQFLKDNYQPALHIETNGLGKFLPGLLKSILQEERLSIAVIEEHSHQQKTTRILQAFDALLAAKNLYMHEKIAEGAFLPEMRDWQPNSPNNRDDALDAVAGCLNHEPVRLPRQFKHFNRPNWRKMSGGIHVHTNFNI